MDMDWTQAVTIIGTNLAVIFGFVIFLLGRMDSNQKENSAKFDRIVDLMDLNHKELEQKMDSNQKDNNAKFEVMNGRFNGLENRLTSLEAEAKNTSQRITDLKVDMNQRLSNIENCVMPRKVFHFEESHKEDPEEPKEN